MLHIRVVTTPGLTGRLLDRLAELPGIRNLSLDHDGAVTVEQVDASLTSTVGAGTDTGLSVRATWCPPGQPARPRE
jgi:hypothetical protein